jgi:hypothetical protein
MKRFTLFAAALIGLSLLTSNAGAQTPDSAFAVSKSGNSLFRVNVNGGAFWGGQYDGGANSGGIPGEGAGTRMMWYPQKAAIRAGYINGTQWDDANIGYFSTAFGENVRASGANTFAAGLRSTASQSSAVALGEDNTASGAASVALGYHASTNARQGSFVFSDRSSPDTLRAGVNHSASWRVIGGFRIFTSVNLSTGVTIQSGAVTSNWGQDNAVISTSTGAYLSTGGTWTNSSDVNRKHFFEDVSGDDILDRLSRVPIRTWSYRAEMESVRHLGPTAQDFHAAFALGNDEKSIATIDADGVALAGVQTLDVRTRDQAKRIESLERENAELKVRLEKIEQSLKRLKTDN